MNIDKGKVLIVDDVPANIKVLGTVLKEECSVIVSNNGIKALEIASSENAPDLILLDIMMPEMDGYEVCKKLKSNPETKNIPVIFLTAKDEGDDEDKGISLGACDYITKPFNVSLVRSRVRTQMKLVKQAAILKQLQKTCPEDMKDRIDSLNL